MFTKIRWPAPIQVTKSPCHWGSRENHNPLTKGVFTLAACNWVERECQVYSHNQMGEFFPTNFVTLLFFLKLGKFWKFV